MIRNLYIVRRDGEPIYGRTFDDENIADLKLLPPLVRNSIILFHSRSSTSHERVYTLLHENSLWSYVFFHSFVLVSLSKKDVNLPKLKSIVLSMGRNLAQGFGQLIETWSGSMSEIVDVDKMIDQYLRVNLAPPNRKMLRKIEKEINEALTKPEIAYVGVFDSSGNMIEGNLPETHLFRIQVEISQGSIKPMMDIVPTSVNSGEYKLQLLRVDSLTIVAASHSTESTLRAVAVCGEIAHALNELM